MNMSQNISRQLEDKLKQYQTLQQKLMSVQQQIQQMKVEQIEIDKALKEIKDLPEDEQCYRNIGRIMVKSTIKDTKTKLTDRKELIETRIELSQKSHDKIQKQFTELEQTIRSSLERSDAEKAS
jgi:prefoldin beta subunit